MDSSIKNNFKQSIKFSADSIEETARQVYRKKMGKSRAMDSIESDIRESLENEFKKTGSKITPEVDRRFDSYIEKRMKYMKKAFSKLDNPKTDKSSQRAELIGDMEDRSASKFGEALGWAKSGKSIQKIWVANKDCCDSCSENEDEGPIDVDEIFPSGDFTAPAHVSCECEVQFVQDEDAMSANKGWTVEITAGGPGSGRHKVNYDDKLAKSQFSRATGHKIKYADVFIEKLKKQSGLILNKKQVAFYKSQIANGKTIAPLFVEPNISKKDNITVPHEVQDGNHRLEALRQLGEKIIRVAYDPITYGGDKIFDDKAIRVKEDKVIIEAGGPGSGCHGDNCGRPSIGIAERQHTPIRGLYNWGASHGESFTITGFSARQMGISGYRLPGWMKNIDKDPALEKRMSSAIKEYEKDSTKLLTAINEDKVGSEEVLYHGFQNIGKVEWEVGDSVTIPLTATSGDKQHAFGYGVKYEDVYQEGAQTAFEFEKGISIVGYSHNNKADQKELGYLWNEAITAGKFQITGIRTEKERGWKQKDVTVVSLKPIEKFNPVSKEWESIKDNLSAGGLEFFYQQGTKGRGRIKVL